MRYLKPLYVFLLLYAVFITGLADGITFGLSYIPVAGTVLGLVITFCINATMGAGLLLALVSLDMWHPRFGPFAVVGSLIPGLDVLPFWVGLVVAGIVYKMNAEGELEGIAGTALKLGATYQSGGNPFQTMRAAAGLVMNERRATGRPPQAAAEPEGEGGEEPASHTLPNLKSPSLAPTINSDIAPARTQPYAKAA